MMKLKYFGSSSNTENEAQNTLEEIYMARWITISNDLLLTKKKRSGETKSKKFIVLSQLSERSASIQVAQKWSK